MWTQKFHNPFTFLKLEFNASWLLFNNIVIILKLEGKEKREFILKIKKKIILTLVAQDLVSLKHSAMQCGHEELS